jgi:hypothetical protein
MMLLVRVSTLPARPYQEITKGRTKRAVTMKLKSGLIGQAHASLQSCAEEVKEVRAEDRSVLIRADIPTLKMRIGTAAASREEQFTLPVFSGSV